MLEREPRLSYFIEKSHSINDNGFQKEIRLAILNSFTINGLEEALRVKCAEKKIKCTSYVSAYGQYSQDVLDPNSRLYEFSPDITFMIVDTRSIMSSLFYNPYSVSASDRRDYVDKCVGDFVALVKSFTKRSHSKLIVTNFCTPTYTPYGICEGKIEYGLREMVRDLNIKLENALQKESSV